MLYHDKAARNNAIKTAERFQPWTMVTSPRRLTTPIVLEGNLRTRYRALVITEYVDMDSGEIIAAAEAVDHGVLPGMRFGERILQRETMMKSLRVEVRAFADFVLKFRNRRRGITPGIGTLVEWYAQFSGKRTCDVRRYVARLVSSGILAGESVLGALFQIAGKRTTAGDHVNEDGRARRVFAQLKRERKAAEWAAAPATDGWPFFTPARKPDWLASVDAEKAVAKDHVEQLMHRLMKATA
jgi:hypothetical protein